MDSDTRDTFNVHPDYRSDIDGLRAIAILSVLGFHAFPSFVPGGFVGVDVFFVISGFLISSIIFRNLDRGSLRLLDFYDRRIKRIFPALIVVLVATLATGVILEFPDEFRYLGRQVFGGAAFVANLLFARESGYFQPASETKPLLHLWSLGVEEQFYLVWPLTAAVIHRAGRRMVLVLVALFIASLAASILLSEWHPTPGFFSPVTRFWELMLGAMLARRELSGPPAVAPRFATAASWIGIALIAASVALFGRDDPFPGWRALLPCAGSALVIAAGGRAWPNSKVLSNRVLVFVGLISYPLYLWHWPILSMSRLVLGELDVVYRIGAVALSILLAWLTYRFIEKPIRFGARARGVALGLCSGIAVLGVVGLAIRFEYIRQPNMGARAEYVNFFEDAPPGYGYLIRNDISARYRLDCDFYDFLKDVKRDHIARDCYTRPVGASRSILLWGDSHAESFRYGLDKALPSEVAILQVTASGCRPAIRPMFPDVRGTCNRANAFALDVVHDVRPDLVVLAQVRDHENTNWEELAQRVRQAGAREVLLLGPLPQWDGGLYKVIARDYWPMPSARVSKRLLAGPIASDARLRAQPSKAYHYLSLQQALCNEHGCLAFVTADPRTGLIAFDYGHLTPAGSEFVGKQIVAPTVLKLLANAHENSAAEPIKSDYAASESEKRRTVTEDRGAN